MFAEGGFPFGIPTRGRYTQGALVDQSTPSPDAAAQQASTVDRSSGAAGASALVERPPQPWLRAAGDRTLQIDSTQLEAIRDQIRSGAERGATAAARASNADSEATSVESGPIGLCLLADFPSGALVHANGELTASVVAALGGSVGGTTVLAVDPEDALGWVHATGPAEDPLARFLELGRSTIHGALTALAQGQGIAVALTAPNLQEDSVVPILLGTHAPSDTVILTAGLQLVVGTSNVAATLYLLVEPKVLAALADAAASGS